MGVIRLLNAAVADQIAAGEVVNRPASVVKELMENSVDAGAKNITLIVHDAGHTMVQVIDDGGGMSAQDAATAFQRHATSKIASAEDLYHLTTFGFRGEALPSIASVAAVDLRTRREEDDLGIELNVTASTVTAQRKVVCPVGTSITVRNLFFNLPARRKFLKSPSYEKRVIISEFEKIALANETVTFTLQCDGDPAPLVLRATTQRQRVADIVKKKLDKALLSVDLTTPHMNLKGWISSPQQSGINATKNSHFFVNGRFMRNTSLQKAVSQAYGRLLPAGHHPYFYIFIEINPSHIDVNIHPTKTEIKFEDEQMVWQLVNSAVRKALGSASVAPSIDFANPVSIDIPIYNPLSTNPAPYPPRTTSAGQSYNPFKFKREAWDPAPEFDPEQAPFREYIPPNLVRIESSHPNGYGTTHPSHTITETEGQTEQYTTIGSSASHTWSDTPGETHTQTEFGFDATHRGVLQISPRYLVTSVREGLVLVDYPRALERIAYDKLTANISQGHEPSQLELIPEQLELTTTDATTLLDASAELSTLGFEIGDMGAGHITVYAMPASLSGKISIPDAIDELIETLSERRAHLSDLRSTLVTALARSASRTKSRTLNSTETQNIIEELFNCEQPSFTVSGLPILSLVTIDDIEKRLKKR